MKHLVYIIPFILLFHSCSKDKILSDDADYHFFLENEDAIMPVQVKGNTNSRVFIIVLHGGPGDSAIRDFGDNSIFKKLEEQYAIVYFDQRCAGLSQGHCNPDELQVQDFVEDIDKLILVIEDIFGNDLSLFLLGHSWGATLGLDYLVHGTEKNKIKGFVQSDGSHNIPMLFVEQKEILIFYANQQIGLGNNIDEWQIILNEVSNADPAIEDDRIKILTNTYQTEELLMSVDSVQSPTLSGTSTGKFVSGIFPALINSSINTNFTLKLFEYNLTDQLATITTPTALYWGKFDLVHPPNMALDIFSKLGSTEKELFFFSKSFHSPMVNENEYYQDKVQEFVETYQ